MESGNYRPQRYKKKKKLCGRLKNLKLGLLHQVIQKSIDNQIFSQNSNYPTFLYPHLTKKKNFKKKRLIPTF